MKTPLQHARRSGLGRAQYWARASRKWGPRLARGFMLEFTQRVRQPAERPAPLNWNPATITASWLGHATVLINFYGLTILTDPVLSHRIGVCVGKTTLGPKRLVAPALRAEELPQIDLILLSHAHMDHLHVATLRRFSAATKVVTARGTADLVHGTGLLEVHELDWGQDERISTHRGEIRVEAFEVEHWGARWSPEREAHRGYNGYILERNGKKIIFGGDTGFGPHFKKLREKGPFEFAIMPIGSYKPGQNSHCTPEEAVQMANDAGADLLLPIHHGTFNFGKEDPSEPLRRLEQALPSERIALRAIGQTFCL